MNVNESPDNEELDELPPDIRAVLAEEAKVEPFISATQDEAILVAARAELGSSKIVVHPLLRTGRWVAVAAATVVHLEMVEAEAAMDEVWLELQVLLASKDAERVSVAVRRLKATQPAVIWV